MNVTEVWVDEMINPPVQYVAGAERIFEARFAFIMHKATSKQRAILAISQQPFFGQIVLAVRR